MPGAKSKRHLTLIEQLETMSIVALVVALLCWPAQWYTMLTASLVIGVPTQLLVLYMGRRESTFSQGVRVIILLFFFVLIFIDYANS